VIENVGRVGAIADRRQRLKPGRASPGYVSAAHIRGFVQVIAARSEHHRAVRSIDQPIAAAPLQKEVPMAFPTHVNDQITDSITQANTKVLGDAPAIAMGNLYQATAQALANAAHNATNAQQQSYVTAQAATTMGVATLYSLDTASTGVATEDIFRSAANSPRPGSLV